MTSLSSRPFIPIAQLLTAVLQTAAEHHRAGREDAASALYQEVLALDPRHADALFLLGVLRRQTGQLGEARQQLREAARWAANRTRIDAELRLVERMIAYRDRKPVRILEQGCERYADGSALATAAQA